MLPQVGRSRDSCLSNNLKTYQTPENCTAFYNSVLFVVTIIMSLVLTIVRQTVNISQAVYTTILLAEKCERSRV